MSSRTSTVVSVIVPTRNAAARTCATVNVFLEAADTSGCIVEVVVIDDGSRDDERDGLRMLDDPRVRILRNDVNLGRGGAVNAGARVAIGDLLLIVDCDCPPVSPAFFTEHLLSIEAGADVSVGALLGRGTDFWSLYQDSAALRREQQFEAGIVYAFTSQNVLMNSSWFRQVDGFDEDYTRYGFEDRDFFIRLAAAGARIAYTPKAGVVHDDENIRLATIAPKMLDAGRFTAPRFRRDHPDAYRALGYAAIDARAHRWLKLVGWVFGRPVLAMVPRIDHWLARLPFSVSKRLAKATVALIFLYGSMHGDR